MINDPFGLTDDMGLSLLFDGRSLMQGTDLLAYLQELRLCLDRQLVQLPRRLEQLEQRQQQQQRMDWQLLQQLLPQLQQQLLLRELREQLLGQLWQLDQQLDWQLPQLEQLEKLVGQLCKSATSDDH